MIIKVEVAASGNKPGAAIFMSVLFIKNGLVPVGAEQDVRYPVGRSAHLLTDSFQVNIRAAFDNQLIMNVADDKAVPESLPIRFTKLFANSMIITSFFL